MCIRDRGYAPPLLERLIATYRDLYSHCFLEPRPFDGIEDLFAALRSAGVALATATSKQAPMALAQFEHLGFMEYFDVVAGATPDPESTKTTVIHEALDRLAALGADVSRPVMVGDSVWDVRGAHEAGLPVIGVGWGYATEGGLDEADWRVETMEELAALCVGGGPV